MYSFLLARIKPDTEYEWFTFKGQSPVTLEFRGKPVLINKGMKFGVRKSSNGKNIRLVLPNDVNRVITIDENTAATLAKGAK
jgi:hypothetical protein